MPYASKAQQRKFHAMLAKGEIDAATVHEFDEATKHRKGGYKSLPEHTKKAGLQDFINTAAESIRSKKASEVDDYTYTSPGQRRWMWASHPDVAKAMETRQITPNMAVDIINARQGKPTRYSIVDFAVAKRRAAEFAQ